MNAERSVDPAPPKPRPRVLVIDDEPSLASTLGLLLRDENDVTQVTSGKQALELLRARHDFDVILCDLMMPSVSGIDVHAFLAREQPGLESRVVFMTGGTFTPAAAQFVASVANPVIEKPFAIDELQALIRTIASR